MGISAAVLRAWELRYGLFSPARTSGGFRLFGPDEERRAARMRAHIARGLAPAESAKLVLSETTVRDSRSAVGELAQAWRSFDETAAQQALDELLGGPEPEVAACRTVLPLLRETAPEHCHFASRMLETRLLALGERWHDGSGPLAVVGCGPGEHHTLATIAFALALHRRAWRIVYLGPDTSTEAFASAAGALRPARMIVTFTVSTAGASGHIAGLAGLARLAPLTLAGPAADDRLARALSATYLGADPLESAAALVS